MEGLIVKNISNDYVIKNKSGIWTCKPRGKFRNDKIVPLVGDYVIFDEINNYILEIKKRKNMLIRPNVANIDQAIIVSSANKQEFNLNLLDKLLTIITYHNIKPIICFTKLDLLEDRNIINKYIDYYESVGYTVITNEKKQVFKDILKDKVTVFTGQSGSGKSTLLNFLDKNLELKTGEISKNLGRGKHTTRHTELYEVYDGYVVDTPGFSSVDLNEMTKYDIRDNMLEMFANLEHCKYRDCLHLKEDGCAVKEKVSSGEILESRYDNYKLFVKDK